MGFLSRSETACQVRFAAPWHGEGKQRAHRWQSQVESQEIPARNRLEGSLIKIHADMGILWRAQPDTSSHAARLRQSQRCPRTSRAAARRIKPRATISRLPTCLCWKEKRACEPAPRARSGALMLQGPLLPSADKEVPPGESCRGFSVGRVLGRGELEAHRAGPRTGGCRTAAHWFTPLLNETVPFFF